MPTGWTGTAGASGSGRLTGLFSILVPVDMQKSVTSTTLSETEDIWGCSEWGGKGCRPQPGQFPSAAETLSPMCSASPIESLADERSGRQASRPIIRSFLNHPDYSAAVSLR